MRISEEGLILLNVIQKNRLYNCCNKYFIVIVSKNPSNTRHI